VNAEFGTKLEGGPISGQRFHLHDLREQIIAARRMRRFDPWRDPAARILGYLPAGHDRWIWRGFNCHCPRVDAQIALAGTFPSEPVTGGPRHHRAA
jgi:hypothetical protein